MNLATLRPADWDAIRRSGYGTVSGNAISIPVSGGASGEINLTGDSSLGDVGRFDGFNYGGSLSVGTNTLTLQSAGFANLGVLTTLGGGTIAANNGVALGVGDNLMGHGHVSGRIFPDGGSTIAASDNIQLGDSNRYDGFFSDGALDVGPHTVELLDKNEVVLGSFTQLGDGSGAGILRADNGLVVEFGKNIVGQGEVDTINDPFRPLINNGSVIGDPFTAGIELNGYVKGGGLTGNTLTTPLN